MGKSLKAKAMTNETKAMTTETQHYDITPLPWRGDAPQPSENWRWNT